MSQPLPFYSVKETLQESRGATLYRAIRSTDQRSVVLKVLDPQHSQAKDYERLKHGYLIGKSLDIPAAIHPLGLETYQGMPALVLEDFGGQSLDHFLDGPMSIERFLKLAIQIAGTVADLHKREVVHKDLKPQNILINPKTDEVKLTDFDFASRLPRAFTDSGDPNNIEGSLPYLSPEQTGRMNRPIDSRADLYALGVTFYQMLTGKLPFEASDPLEWVHCHIALPPRPLVELVPQIPQPLQDIVLKLMSKAAEDRYQTASGLQIDLQRCLDSWRSMGRIDRFPLARVDVAERLHVSQKLYGRENDMAALLSAFDRASKGSSELMLIGGYSGIGKSALAYELYKPLTGRRGYFIAGKYDQFQRNIPYTGIASAFRELSKQIATENEQDFRRWRSQIQAALQGNGQVLIDVIPELEQIIGKQPPVQPLGPAEAQTRFLRVFQKWVRVFCQAEFPLTIFLDDLQWADAASFKLIELMLTDAELKRLLVIGAYRTNEVSPSHALNTMVDGLHKRNVVVNRLLLAPLDQEMVCQEIADTLRLDLAAVRSLSILVTKKTGGNPFFVNQFLRTLHEKKLLTYSTDLRRWEWNIAHIEAQHMTENVVELLIGKLRQLPADTQQALMLAACLGNRFDQKALGIISQQTPDRTYADLLPALREGLVNTVAADLEGADENTPLHSSQQYQFLHDRVRQASYAMIPEQERGSTHASIGRLLLKSTGPSSLDENIFDIAYHLNRGIECLSSPNERQQLAEFNLRAGQRALLAAAFDASCDYFMKGIELLPGDGWKKHHALTRDLHAGAAEAACLNVDFGTMKRVVDVAMREIGDVMDKTKLYELLILYHHTQAEFRKAVEIAVQTLAQLGETFPTNPGPQDFAEAYARTLKKIDHVGFENLSKLPPMTDARKLAAMPILRRSVYPAYFAVPEMLGLLTCRCVELTIDYGSSPLTAYAFSAFSVLANGGVGDIQTGSRFGELAIDLYQRQNDPYCKAVVYNNCYGLSRHFYLPVREVVAPLIDGYLSYSQNGDAESASYCLINGFVCAILSGQSLEEVKATFGKHIKDVFSLKQEQVINQLHTLRQLCRNLMGRSSSTAELEGPVFDADARLPGLYETRNFNTVNYVRVSQLLLCFIFERYAEAYVHAAEAEQTLGSSPGKFFTATHNFLYSLSMVALYTTASEGDRQRYRQKIVENQRRLKRWAEACATNFLQKYLLVEAEIARIDGRTVEAMDLYDRSIASATEHGFTHEAALANELAGRFYLGRGHARIADLYLRDARACYARWGAAAKVKQLDARFPRLRERREHSPTTTVAVGAEQLDLLSVMKASQTISSEIQIEELVRTLLKVVLEQVGAQRGLLLLVQRDEPTIEAEAIYKGREISTAILQSVPMSSHAQLLPTSIVRYVVRTQERVLLDDAAQSPRFSSDEYIARAHPLSVLCLPILRQAEVVALLYLENNMLRAAFTPERLAALELLASQAAISVENALLLSKERASKEAAKAAERRAALLAEVGTLLSESLDYTETISRLGQLCIRSLGDVCVIDVVEDGVIRRWAGAYTDPQLKPKLLELQQRHPPRWESSHPATQVLRTGKSLLFPDLTDELRRQLCEDEEHFEITGALGLRTMMAVPLMARGQTLGVLNLGSTRPGRRYQRQDLELLEEVARRAAMAIDNARLHLATQQAVHMRDEFLSIASHELYTPMTSLMLSLQAMLGSASAGQRTDLLQLASRQGRRLTRLIRDLLDVSRIEAGRLPLERTEVDLTSMAKEVVERLRPDTQRANCEICWRFDAPGPIVGHWDRSQIDQVITNLLSNAMKFGEQKPVEISLGQEGPRAWIKVRDHGIGIEPARQTRLFNRFERGVSSRNYGGLGLGLYISRKIVEAHGGSIGVESTPGQGSTFMVELPVHPH